MDLILWRHAEAVEAEPGGDDLGRGLTPRGQKQAARMAEWLNRFLPEGTRVLVSPALRCQQTARALERRWRTLDALAPDASPVQLLAAARWPDAREPALLVGHQPALGQVAAWLMAGAGHTDRPAPTGLLPGWSIRKGGVWWLRQRQREAGPEVVLVAVRSPGML